MKHIVFVIFIFTALVSHAQSFKSMSEEELELSLRQELFPTYGLGQYGDVLWANITNELASEVIPKLEYAITKWQSAPCEFMLACLFCGYDVLKLEEFEEDEIPTLKDYKYYNKDRAAVFFLSFITNEDKTIMPFGYQMDDCITLMTNAFGGEDLESLKKNLITRIQSYKRKQSEELKKLVPDTTKNTTPPFGVG